MKSPNASEQFRMLKYRVSLDSVCIQLAFLKADTLASFGVLPLSRLRAYTQQEATFYTCSYLYTGNSTISTVKSCCSHWFNCLKLFYGDREYP